MAAMLLAAQAASSRPKTHPAGRRRHVSRARVHRIRYARNRMSNNDPFSSAAHGLDFARTVQGQLRGETPLRTLQREEQEARAREINDRMFTGGYVETSGDYRITAPSAANSRRGLILLLKVAAGAVLLVTSLVMMAVAVPQTRYPTLLALSGLARLPDDIVPSRASKEPPLLLVTRALRLAPAKERMTAANLQRFGTRVLGAGVTWEQLDERQRRVVLAAYRARTEPYSREEFWMLTKAERARFDAVFAGMINAAAAADQAAANRASRLLSGIGDMDQATMERLRQTPFAGSWRARLIWLSNQLMYHAERARRSRAQESISLQA
ncbi:hypothetical protein RZA67_10125 [Stenotrophomonas sp. C3(2023)]|uniref:hypothetical protein n=1 Tax=Stenotrophomonas sp. C3(2023) TaxID=3080277 RepID=UPI00293CE5DE|nr:hypothetical protein [Stenotrophomonas sp. C3(2023)]MDV3469083.1 hypothetical protein [Stenotrophomonas sp. C3(2023)]